MVSTGCNVTTCNEVSNVSLSFTASGSKLTRTQPVSVPKRRLRTRLQRYCMPNVAFRRQASR